MRISQQDVLEFARWSGDRNPIHVDPVAAKKFLFGGTVVRAALSTIALLTEAQGFEPQVGSLEIEFRSEARPDITYSFTLSQKSEKSSIDFRSDGEN